MDGFNERINKTQAEKGLVFAQCIFLVNFGRNLHIFAFSCIISLNFADKFAKYHQKKKPQNDRKNGPKMVQKWSENSPKRLQNGVKTTPKRPQNDPKMIPK